MEINKNNIIEEVIKYICDDCKSCWAECTDKNTKEQYKIKARYCADGSGDIEVDIYTIKDVYVDTCKLKYPGDASLNPFTNMKLTEKPDCYCE